MDTLITPEQKIEALEKRVAALEENQPKQEVRCVTKEYKGDRIIYVVSDQNSCSSQGQKNFPLIDIVVALANKVGLQIVYQFPSSERVEYK